MTLKFNWIAKHWDIIFVAREYRFRVSVPGTSKIDQIARFVSLRFCRFAKSFLTNLDGLKHVRVNIYVWILVSSTKNERFYNKNLQSRVKWFNSDLAQTKFKKFKFWKNFPNNFCQCLFRKAVKKFPISEYVIYLTKRYFSNISKNF